jgi:hypothetical protein
MATPAIKTVVDLPTASFGRVFLLCQFKASPQLTRFALTYGTNIQVGPLETPNRRGVTVRFIPNPAGEDVNDDVCNAVLTIVSLIGAVHALPLGDQPEYVSVAHKAHFNVEAWTATHDGINLMRHASRIDFAAPYLAAISDAAHDLTDSVVVFCQDMLASRYAALARSRIMPDASGLTDGDYIVTVRGGVITKHRPHVAGARNDRKPQLTMDERQDMLQLRQAEQELTRQSAISAMLRSEARSRGPTPGPPRQSFNSGGRGGQQPSNQQKSTIYTAPV